MATRLQEALAALRAHQSDLERRGVQHAAVFGSVARGDDQPASDVDILVDIDPKRRPFSVFDFTRLQLDLQEIIPGAELVERDALLPVMKHRVLAEAIDVF